LIKHPSVAMHQVDHEGCCQKTAVTLHQVDYEAAVRRLQEVDLTPLIISKALDKRRRGSGCKERLETVHVLKEVAA